MLVTDIIRLATRMFRTNRSRTLLTILGISVGIGTILFLVSLGYGLQNLILNEITTSEALLSLDVTAGEAESIRMDYSTIDELEQIPEVEKISPLVTARTQMTVDDISSELTVNFANRDYFRLEGTSLMEGDFYYDDDAGKNKVIISSAALQLFNLDPEAIMGKPISFIFFTGQGGEGQGTIIRDFIDLERDFRVVGVIEEENSSYVYLPFAVSQELGLENFSKLKVKVDKEPNLEMVREEIIGRGYQVSALSDIIEQANQVFRVVQIVLASFGIVALIVSAIGMFNTMTIALLERTQEIGIMKALGATSVDIWNMFLAESVVIGFCGGLGGIILGMLGGTVFNYGVNTLASALGGERIDMFYTPIWFVAVIITFSTVVGLATGFYPAKRAARINTLEALRYK